VSLAIQIALFLLTSIYTLRITVRAEGAVRHRHLIIGLTANAFDEDVQRSMQAGLNAHLSKPVEPEALFETLETLIRP
jgi:CheY-like chemotaxis protein